MAAACVLATAAAAQAAPFEVQGSVRSITTLASGDVQLVCGGQTLLIRPTQSPAPVLHTPAGALTLAQLVDATPFPYAGFNPLTGQPRAGFVGATCTAIGDDALVPGQYAVTDLMVEVEENVLVGTTTATDASGALVINGVRAKPQPDARMSAVRPAAGLYNANGTHPADGLLASVGLLNNVVETVRNDAGVGVDPTSVPAGTAASANGYFGTNGTLYAHALEVSGGNLLRTEPRPAASRAQCTNEVGRAGRDRVEVRGGCVMPRGTATATVTIEGVLPNGTFQTYGTAACTPAVDLPTPAGANYTLGLFRYNGSALTLNGDVCPEKVRVRTTQAGVTRYDWISTDLR